MSVILGATTFANAIRCDMELRTTSHRTTVNRIVPYRPYRINAVRVCLDKDLTTVIQFFS